jgi:hypothetical protein
VEGHSSGKNIQVDE